jgi:hypothetical protein
MLNWKMIIDKDAVSVSSDCWQRLDSEAGRYGVR